MNEWNNIIFQVFDAPEFPGNFEERLAFLHQQIPENQTNVRVVTFTKCEGKDHLIRKLEGNCLLTSEFLETMAMGGEGLMLRRANSPYRAGRSSDLLKVKVCLGFPL